MIFPGLSVCFTVAVALISSRHSFAAIVSTDASAPHVFAGSFGIGTSLPGNGTKLSVEGQIRSKSSTTTSNAVDWSLGNAVSTSFDCGSSITFANLRDGGSYSLVVTGAGTTLCSFDTGPTGDDAATVTYRFGPTNAARVASSHTVYSFLRIGTIVYVSWITGL